MPVIRQFTRDQREFLRVLKEYGDEVVDNGNVMNETGWEKKKTVAVGLSLEKRGILDYSRTDQVGFEGGIWQRSKVSKEVRERRKP